MPVEDARPPLEGPARSRRKWYVLGAIGVLTLVTGVLCAFTWISDAHPVAQASIRQSPRVASAVGPVEHVVLLGFRQRLSGLHGCTTATYVVHGHDGLAGATVVLTTTPENPTWQTQGLSVGWFTSPAASC